MFYINFPYSYIICKPPIVMMAMEKTRKELISEVLNDLSKSVPDIEFSTLVSADGIIITSTNSEKIKSESAGAIIASLASVNENATKDLMNERLQYAYAVGKNGYIVLSINDNGEVLSAVVKNSEQIDKVFNNMRMANEKIENNNGC